MIYRTEHIETQRLIQYHTTASPDNIIYVCICIQTRIIKAVPGFICVKPVRYLAAFWSLKAAHLHVKGLKFHIWLTRIALFYEYKLHTDRWLYLSEMTVQKTAKIPATLITNYSFPQHAYSAKGKYLLICRQTGQSVRIYNKLNNRRLRVKRDVWDKVEWWCEVQLSVRMKMCI